MRTRRARILVVALGLLCVAAPLAGAKSKSKAKSQTTTYKGTINGLDGSTAQATYAFKGNKLTLTVNAHFTNCNPAGSGLPTTLDYTYTNTIPTHTDPAGTGFELATYDTNASSGFGPSTLAISAYGASRGDKVLALLTINLNSNSSSAVYFNCSINNNFKPMTAKKVKKKHKKKKHKKK